MTQPILTHIHDIPIRRNFIENLPYNPKLVSRAKSLRKAGNFPEVVFWKQVRNHTFWNIDFDRQRIIGNYIVDFYIKALGMIVEIDGESHNDKEEYDERRENYFRSLGLKIFKTANFRILHDLENVMRELERFIIEEFGIKEVSVSKSSSEPPRLSATPPEEGNHNDDIFI
ncbi:MAG: endonuclease domain-containing protein [Flavobacterium sp.]